MYVRVCTAAAVMAIAALPEAMGFSGVGAPLTASRSRTGSSRTSLRMSTMPNKKVVVTGIGALSSIGNGEDFMPGILEGAVGITQLPSWADDFPSKMAGQVTFTPAEWYGNKKEAKRQSRYMNLCVAGSKLGMADAGLDKDGVEDKSRFGIFIGSAIGGSDFYEDASEKWAKASEYNQVASGKPWGDASFAGRNGIFKGPEHLEGAKFTFEGFKKISPFIVPAFIMNSGSGVAAVEVDAQGPNYCIGGYGGEGAGGAISIGQAHRFLSTGECDVFIAGGSEAFLTPAMIAGFNKMPGISKGDPSTFSAFSTASEGYHVGEACGVLVMETADHASKRGAKPYCELAGFAVSHENVADAELGMCSMPTKGAVASSITKALALAGVKPDEVGYVCAHGSGVIEHDRTETAGIKEAFGAHASKLKISSIKAQTGNCLSASSAMEAAVCAYAIKHGKVPGSATLQASDVDGDCDLDYLPGPGAKDVSDVKVAISVNLALGGQATCLVFKKC